MEVLKEKITKEEIYGYKAFDGTFFEDEDECKKYEGSAKGVLKKFFLDHVVKTIPSYNFGPCIGTDDQWLELVDIPDVDVALKIEQYLELANKDNKYNKLISAEDAGKRIWMLRSYDEYYEALGTTEEFLETMRKDLQFEEEK